MALPNSAPPPPFKPFTPSSTFMWSMGHPDGSKYFTNDTTGNIIIHRPDGSKYFHNIATNRSTVISDGTVPPASPKPATVNDRPPLIDDVEDEDDRDLAQLITNITFKGSMTPQEIVKLIRDQGWIPGADFQRVSVQLRETEDELFKLKYPNGVVAEEDVKHDQASRRIIRGGRGFGKSSGLNKMVTTHIINSGYKVDDLEQLIGQQVSIQMMTE